MSPEIVERCTLIAVNFPFSHSNPLLVIEELQRYPDLILINSKVNMSLYEAWNLAIKNSDTEFVSNLNLDDRVDEDYYKYALAQLNEAQADVFSSFSIGTSTIGVRSSDAFMQNHIDQKKFNNQDIAEYNLSDLITVKDGRVVKKSVPHCAPVWRRSLHKALGYFNSERFDFCADFEFWLRVAASKKKLIVSKHHKTLFYCARNTASDRLLHPENITIIERWKNSFPPAGYKETHLGQQHDLLHHCMNMNAIFSSEKYYQHLENEPIFKSLDKYFKNHLQLA